MTSQDNQENNKNIISSQTSTHPEDQKEGGLISYFDEKLEEFHDWVVHLRERREEELKEKEKEEQVHLKQLEVAVESTSTASSSLGAMVTRKESLIFRISGGIVVLLGYFLFQSLEYVYLILTGIILSMAAESFIDKLSTYIPRGVSILLVYIFLILFILSGIVLVIPFLVQQAADLVNMFINSALVWREVIQTEGLSSLVNQMMLPSGIRNSLASFLETTNLQESIQEKIVENISGIVSMGTTYIKNAGDFAVGTLGSVFSGLFQIAIVFMVAIFASLEKRGVETFISGLSSQPKRMNRTVEKLYDKLGHWLLGQFLLCVIVGVCVGFGLQIVSRFGIDIPNKFTLALIAGLTEFLPYIGPLLGGVPGLLVGALAYGRQGFVVMFIMYGIIQQVENNILVPLIMSQTLGVSPLLIFICMLVCGLLLGLLGVIIAVPIALIINIFYKEYKSRYSNVSLPKE